jgi:hypothetical protein
MFFIDGTAVLQKSIRYFYLLCAEQGPKIATAMERQTTVVVQVTLALTELLLL